MPPDTPEPQPAPGQPAGRPVARTTALRLLRAVIGFELRYQLRGAAFWVCTAIFAVMPFLMVALTAIPLGTDNVHRNAPSVILSIETAFSFLSLFIVASLAANAVIRDEETGFGPILGTTRLTPPIYVLGRFLGTFLACCLVFLAVPLGAVAASFMPWIDPLTLGPVHPVALAAGLVVIALPNLLFVSAAMFAAATLTRRMMGTYIVAVLLVMANMLETVVAGRLPRLERLMAYLDPAGGGALDLATRYWTPLERNLRAPPLTGLVLANRAIWVTAALALLGLSMALFAAARRWQARPPASAPDDTPPTIRDVAALPRARLDAAALRAQFLLRLRFEIAQIVRSPGFVILLLLGLGLCFLSLIDLQEIYGTPAWPETTLVIGKMSPQLITIAFLIVTVYAGDIIWRERERGIDEIIGTTPAPGWLFLAAKLPATSVLVFATLLCGAAFGMAFQLAHGYTRLEPAQYLLWFVLPVGVQMSLLAVLAITFQAVAPQKFAGWGLMLLFFVSRSALGAMGHSDILYTYAQGPGLPLSDMNGVGIFWKGVLWSDLYWIGNAGLMLVAVHLLWPRSARDTLAPRLRALPRRFIAMLRRPVGLAAILAPAALAAVAGTVIFHNTHVLNHSESLAATEREQAAYERALLPFRNAPQPEIARVTFAIDIHPRAPAVTVTGRYDLVNRTSTAIDHIHVRMLDDNTHLQSMAIQGATLERDLPRFHYRIYRLDTPLAPGAHVEMTFRTRRGQTGFTEHAYTGLGVFPNGTFLNNQIFAPVLGMDTRGLLLDAVKRRKYHLPPLTDILPRDGAQAREQNYIHAGWTSADITVTTDADQTPVAPGDRISDVTHDGRRTAHFVTTAPVLNFFAVLSARYAEHHAACGSAQAPVDCVVYYDPHHAMNVERMIRALKAGLAYDTAHFGPYPFHEIRIVEFPGYITLAQAFAGTIPYSENIGFIANLSDPSRIDYVSYVTAHELAHQWWAHQVAGADIPGAPMLSETLAQYSALMTMRTMQGPDKIRRFLKYELDSYLRARGGGAQSENPLRDVEVFQPYIYYNKGSGVTYRLQSVMGADRLNNALRGFLDANRFKGPPWPRSRDLLALIHDSAPDENTLIDDLFAHITLYDLKTVSATARARPDGRYDLALTVSARKLYATPEGKESEAPMHEPVDLGIFTAMPGDATFDRANVLAFQRVDMTSGTHTFNMVVDRKPAFAGIDPYVEMIDRAPEDNVAAVHMRGQ